MAFKTLGISGVLTFSTNAAIASMKQASVMFNRTQKAIQMLGPAATKTAFELAVAGMKIETSMKRVGFSILRMAKKSVAALQIVKNQFKLLGQASRHTSKIVTTAAVAMLPLGLATAKGAQVAANYEQKMSGVQAILRATKAEMEPLARETRRMGIVSAFSASQSAEAAEFMARAGFNQKQIIDALGETMNAAAAEGLGLAEATNIITSNVRAFGLSAGEAGRVADVLALASARTNTSMADLNEALRYTAPTAKRMGMNIESTSAVLGLLADTGIKGSLAGTSLKNALLKLASPAGKGRSALKKLGLTVSDVHGNFVGMNSILNQLSTGVNKIGGNIKQTEALAQLFGLRGIALTNILNRLQKQAGSGQLTFGELENELNNAAGAAQKMADTRLDNLLGQLTLFRSSLEGLGIQMFSGMLGPMKESVKGVTDGLNNVLFAMEALKGEKVGKGIIELPTQRELESRFGTISTAIATGIQDAMMSARNSFRSVVHMFRQAGQALEDSLGKDGIRKLTKFITIAATASTIIIPALVAFKLFGMLLSGTVVPAIKLLGIAFKLALGPVGLVVGGLVILFMALRKENESMLTTTKRVWGTIKGVFMTVWSAIDNTVGAFFRGIGKHLSGLFDSFSSLFKSIWNIFDTVFGWMWETGDGTTSKLGKAFTGLGELVGTVVLSIAKGFANVFNQIDDWIHGSRSTIQEWINAIRLQGIRDMLERGIITQGEFEKRKKRLTYVGFQIGEDKRKRKTFIQERENDLKKLQELNKRTTEQRVAPVKRKLQVEAPKITIDDKRTIEVTNNLNLDGGQVASSLSKHQLEVLERAGGKVTPWQRRAAMEFGAIPAAIK